MASIGFLIGGALVNASAFTSSKITRSVAYLKDQLIKNERGTIKLSKIYKELK